MSNTDGEPTGRTCTAPSRTATADAWREEGVEAGAEEVVVFGEGEVVAVRTIELVC